MCESVLDVSRSRVSLTVSHYHSNASGSRITIRDVVPQLVVGLFFLPRDAMHKRGFC